MEIKEILEFKENADYKRLSCDEIKVLRDYITNLQEELEEEKRINQEDLKYIDELNERIDKAVEYIQTNEGYSQLSGIWEFYDDTDDLLNILNGKE